MADLEKMKVMRLWNVTSLLYVNIFNKIIGA